MTFRPPNYLAGTKILRTCYGCVKNRAVRHLVLGSQMGNTRDEKVLSTRVNRSIDHRLADLTNRRSLTVLSSTIFFLVPFWRCCQLHRKVQLYDREGAALDTYHLDKDDHRSYRKGNLLCMETKHCKNERK